MVRYRRRFWIVAACLSAVAGYVDAIAFVELNGFFVSFMSGNSTRLGVALGSQPHFALTALGLIASFVLGVMIGAIANTGKHTASTRVLLVVSLMLSVSAACAAFGATAPAMALLAAAMGAENAVFKRDGEVGIGLTYMTGALVKLGQHLSEALRGGAPFAWAPYLLLWSGLVAGAACGVLVYTSLALASIWLAAGAMAAIALALRLIPEAP
jgi:uncharacterized membrane protein YoaK (UPF0700 family)